MLRLHFLVAMLLLFAPPVLQLYLASRGMPPVPVGVNIFFGWIFWLPIGFYPAAVIGYSIASAFVRNEGGYRVPTAIAVLLLVFVVSAPLMALFFGVQRKEQVMVLLAILALLRVIVGGALHVRLLRSGLSAWVEFAAHIVTALLPIAFLSVLAPTTWDYPNRGFTADLPVLFAVLPFAALIHAQWSRGSGARVR